MPAISRERFGAPKDLKRAKFQLQPWGWDAGEYLVLQAMSSRGLLEMQALTAAAKTDEAKFDAMAQALAKAVMDDVGNPLCEPADIMAKGLPFLEALFEALMNVSSIRKDPDEEDGLPNSPGPSVSSPA